MAGRDIIIMQKQADGIFWERRTLNAESSLIGVDGSGILQTYPQSEFGGTGSIESASYAGTASVLLGSVESASYAETANTLLGSVESASYAGTSSYLGGGTYYIDPDRVGQSAQLAGHFSFDAHGSIGFNVVGDEFGLIGDADDFIAAKDFQDNYQYGGGNLTVTNGTVTGSNYIKANSGFVGNLTGSAQTSVSASYSEASTTSVSASYTNTIQDRILFINHGSTAGTARPNASIVYWVGTVEPTNAINADIWFSGSLT